MMDQSLTDSSLLCQTILQSLLFLREKLVTPDWDLVKEPTFRRSKLGVFCDCARKTQ